MDGSPMVVTHKWATCSFCGPMVRCGYCGNNCCNGVSGENCPDKCASAYEMQRQELPEHRAIISRLANGTTEKKDGR